MSVISEETDNNGINGLNAYFIKVFIMSPIGFYLQGVLSAGERPERARELRGAEG